MNEKHPTHINMPYDDAKRTLLAAGYGMRLPESDLAAAKRTFLAIAYGMRSKGGDFLSSK